MIPVSDMLALLSQQNKIDLYYFKVDDLGDHGKITENIEEDCNRLLDKSEQARANRFKFDFLRVRFILARVQLRKILMRYTHRNPVIQVEENGKPYLKEFPELKFNLSHSENRGLCAITLNTPVGVDLECIAKPIKINYLAIAKRFFSDSEFQALTLSLSPEKLFYQLWTRKEAYIKLQGKKLLDEIGRACINNNSVYESHDFCFEENYMGALAVRKCDKKIVIYHV